MLKEWNYTLNREKEENILDLLPSGVDIQNHGQVEIFLFGEVWQIALMN